MNIVRWPRHIRSRCPPGLDLCIEGRCAFCSGGLFFCATCRCGEGTLPTECPGEPVDYDTQELVAHGKLDFAGGVWTAVGESTQCE